MHKAKVRRLLALFTFFLFSCGFLYGFAIPSFNLFPYQKVKVIEPQILETIQRPTGPNHVGFIQFDRYEGQGVLKHDPEKAFPGVTTVASQWKRPNSKGNSYQNKDFDLGVRLIDMKGTLLHTWSINPEEIWEKTPYDDFASGSKDDRLKTYYHGTHLFENGDMIINLEYFGLIRIDKNSKIIWKLPYRTHHSVYFNDDDQTLWVCGSEWHEESVAQFPGMNPPFVEDLAVQIDPETGEILEKISIFEVIYQSGHEGLFREMRMDILHLNDVEILSEVKAKKFPNFSAGDIMVSMRDISSVFVIDAKTHLIKWSMNYPFVRQHDPDFTDHGTIILFDNHVFDIESNLKRIEFGSRILEIYPENKGVKTLFGRVEKQRFFTVAGGKQQILPNGNVLVTEMESGRAIEFTPSGEIAWEWQTENWSPKRVAGTASINRYPESYVNFLTSEKNLDETTKE